jgi:aspartate dehydrogenase
MKPLSFALIGFGGISREVLRIINDDPGLPLVCTGVLVRPQKRDEIARELGGRIVVAGSLDELMHAGPRIVADCAGHEALRTYGAGVLRANADLLTVSSGAFADAATERALQQEAAAAGRRILIAPGAIAGIDGLAAARIGGLEEVVYTGRKPVAAWRGTAAETVLDLSKVDRAATFFQGYARKAAAEYPKNANVTATIALAGLGFDSTRVELVADPTLNENVHELYYRGAFGEARIRIAGRPSAGNARTSALTAFSVLRTLLGSCEGALVL